LALAIAPGLAICFYILHQDRHNPEPKPALAISFFLGMLTIIPAYFIEAYTGAWVRYNVISTILSSFVAIALVEELLKFMAVRHYCFTRPTFDEPFDGIVYSVFVGMGFATLENIAYVLKHGYSVVFARMFTSVPAHASFAAIMGYYIGKAKFEPRDRGKLFRKGILMATLFHGAYDSFIFLSDDRWLKQYVSEVLIFTGAVASLYTAFRLSRKLFRLHQLTSQQLFQDAPALTIRSAAPDDIELIRGLCLEVWPQTYAAILEPAQIQYMLDRMYSPLALQKQFDDGHRFLIISNAGVPIGFASFSETGPTVFTLHKIYILPVQQGRGIGRDVITFVTGEIRSLGATALRLNVNRHNKARAFYEKLGFTAIYDEDIDIGNGYFMNDHVMEFRMEDTNGPALETGAVNGV
jgi:RsiW-degrading membrane proteinase PrsW (M82 family)/ribosomal protein S18 acetylase RimI-like enzyme